MLRLELFIQNLLRTTYDVICTLRTSIGSWSVGHFYLPRSARIESSAPRIWGALGPELGLCLELPHRRFICTILSFGVRCGSGWYDDMKGVWEGWEERLEAVRALSGGVELAYTNRFVQLW